MRKLLFTILIIPTLIGCGAKNKPSLPKKEMVFHCVCEDDKANPEFNYDFKEEIAIGDNIASMLIYDAVLSEVYMTGIYIDEDTAFAKASALVSYDGSFDSITIKYGLKENNPDYLSKFNGTYRNQKNDELVVDNNIISWDYTVAEGHVLHFKTSQVTSDGKDVLLPNEPHLPTYAIFAPYFNTLLLNDEISAENRYSSINLSFYSCEKLGINYVTFPMDFSTCREAIADYCQKHNINFDVDRDELFLDYSGKNNVVIDNDL